ncbi:MAG: hypothetical protein K2X11_10895 [Acetobacteraceae bacterium]|nr:hypothetical protein [Acetobacteraceae bacterium]
MRDAAPPHGAAWTRRSALLLPGVVAACAAPPPPPLEGPPIGYGHLTQLRLDVASIDIDARDPVAGPNDLGRELRPTAAEAVRIMGRDRLAAFGTQNTARFTVVAAQILRERPAGRVGTFAADPGETLNARFACRLEILAPDGRRLGFSEAQATRTRTAESTPAARLRVAESLMRLAMFDLNTEFEFQLRRALRPYLSDGPAGAAPPPAPVLREALPPA